MRKLLSKDGLCRGLAWLLPRRVVYFCVIRAWAFATCGEYGTTVATEVTADEVVQRWDKSLYNRETVQYVGVGQ